jgi:hypothetical protein
VEIDTAHGRLVESADVGRAVTEERDRDQARAGQAAPAAVGKCAPTIAYEPSIPAVALVSAIRL